MKKLISLILCLFIFSCADRKRPMYVLNAEQKQKVADFVSKNIKPANNMSDEEMEDVIYALKNTGIALLGEQRLVPCDWEYHVIWEEVIKKDSTETFYYR